MSGEAGTCALAAEPTAAERLPLSGLLALACAGFITILTEALPAGLLSPMSADLGVSRALVGQLVTIYAFGSLVAALPMTALTQRLPRRPLLLAAIAGFVVVNTVTALTHHYAVMLVARFVAGINAWIGETERDPSLLPVEFAMLGIRPGRRPSTSHCSNGTKGT